MLDLACTLYRIGGTHRIELFLQAMDDDPGSKLRITQWRQPVLGECCSEKPQANPAAGVVVYLLQEQFYLRPDDDPEIDISSHDVS